MLDTEFLSGLERLTAAAISRAAKDDPEAFAQVVKVLDSARARLPYAAHMLTRPTTNADGVTVPGYSWAEIAAPLGITRQAAHSKYGQG